MKIDRLLGITIYLLNRGKVSARVLADKFEVSQRTIQRDIDALNMAGIPIVSTYGVEGGYEITDSFKMERQAASVSDYSFILTALKGLSTAYSNPKIDHTLQKILSITEKNSSVTNILLDFGVLQEARDINTRLQLLESAISAKKGVTFNYTNAENKISHREIDPVILSYRWYSWYVFGFCTDKQDYRLFKLFRMTDIKVTDKPFSREHESGEVLLARHEKADVRTYIDIKLFCKAEVKTLALEYLNGSVEKQYDNGDFILNLHLPEGEHLWFGTLLSLGNKAVVLEPEGLRNRLCEKAKEILKVYR